MRVYTINHKNNDMFDSEVGEVVNVLFSENNPNNIALLTIPHTMNKTNYFLYHLDMKNHRWNLVSEDVIKANWNDDSLFYLHTSNSSKVRKTKKPDLKSYNVDTGDKVVVASSVTNFGFTNKIMWMLSKNEEQDKFAFLIDEKLHEANISNIKVLV
ncbi:hypothetical protein RF11_02701 [Thelohanellus kitauei]|uniref:Uncharacterized protein n=1 Tax=Thelohanellus kitauei TaxID=669202 RepID=A0A0C2MDQ9_THEKT|nr:hypothetical protein RF11_02701 [Thelohanellus kitauei]